MKTNEDILQRLLRAASRATPGPEDPPLGLESRILASWRTRTGRESFDSFGVLRPVLMGSLALVCVAGALEYKTLNDDDAPTTLTNTVFLTALNR